MQISLNTQNINPHIIQNNGKIRKKETSSLKNITSDSVNFTGNYKDVLKYALDTDILNFKAAKDIYTKLVHALIDEGYTTTGDFRLLKNNDNLTGILQELATGVTPGSKRIYQKFECEPIKMGPIPLINKNEATVLELYDMEKAIDFKSIKRNPIITFIDPTDSGNWLSFSLNKNTYQIEKRNGDVNTITKYHSSTLNKKKEVINTANIHETTYYNQNGKPSAWKNFFFGGPYIVTA